MIASFGRLKLTHCNLLTLIVSYYLIFYIVNKNNLIYLRANLIKNQIFGKKRTNPLKQKAIPLLLMILVITGCPKLITSSQTVNQKSLFRFTKRITMYLTIWESNVFHWTKESDIDDNLVSCSNTIWYRSVKMMEE